MICTPIYTLSTTIYSLYTPYLQPIFTYVNLIYNLYAAVYSYFEKGCRKKCMRHSRRALWVVLSALFFKEIGKKGTGGHGQVFTSAKGKQQTWVRHLYTPYIQLLFTLYATYIHLIFNLYSSIYTLYATYIHFIVNLYSLYTPYLQPIFTYVNLIVNLYSPIYTLYTTYIRHILTIFNNYPSSPNGLLTQRPCNLYTVTSGIRHNKWLHYTPLVPLIVLLLVLSPLSYHLS